MRIITVAAMPTMYIPAPNAMPMPAVAQTPAAVVSPVIVFLWTNIMPAPKKPIPDTI